MILIAGNAPLQFSLSDIVQFDWWIDFAIKGQFSGVVWGG